MLTFIYNKTLKKTWMVTIIYIYIYIYIYSYDIYLVYKNTVKTIYNNKTICLLYFILISY